MSDIGFWRLAEQNPDELGLVADDGTEITRGELLARVNRLANGMRSVGLRRGDGIAVTMWNEPAFVELYMAAMEIGLFFTPVNFHLTGPEIAYIVGDCEAKAYFCSARFADTSLQAMNELDFPHDRRFCSGDASGFVPVSELAAGQPDTTPDEASAGQTMLYTSGTTGRPKGVRRPLPEGGPNEGAAVAVALAFLFDMQMGEGVHLVAGPLYHAAPLAFGMGSMHIGQAAVLMDRWSPEGTLERIERYRVTSTHMVPTMFHRLLALPDEVKQRYDTSSLRNVVHAAAPCPVDVKRGMLEWWRPVIYEYYAATEGGGTVVKPQEWLEHPGTVGQPWPNSEIKILDDAGNPCPTGEPGTVYMKSAIAAPFEYYKDREKTERSWRGEFFTVGDVGYLDEGGWLYLCDRKADMIISGGVNIYPAEVEGILLTHPDVGDAAVIGVPNPEWGEEVKAVVQPADGVEPSEELARQLVAFCRDRLAHYKCPRSVDFRPELPRYPTGKLYKRLIRDDYWKDRERAI